MSRIAVLLLAFLAAAPVAAQEWQVARQEFAFADTRLTILVDVDVPGTLRLIRGEPGSVRVAGRARDGFTSGGLAENNRLTLSAAGDGPVDYLVVVPENVWVDMRLPGRTLGENVARGHDGTWEWGAAERPDGAPVTEWVPGLDPEGELAGPLYTTFSRDLAPEEISVPDLAVVARMSVRIQAGRFKIISSRPLGVDEGNPQRLVIRPAAPPMELVLSIPAATRAFTLRLGGDTALLIQDGIVTTLCSPVTEQWLSNDRRWFTFNPLDASLRCTGDTIQRHGG